MNDRAVLRRGESCLGSIVSVLPLAPDQPKTSGQVLGSLKTDILRHWESPLQQIQSDSVGGWQLQRSERNDPHGGEEVKRNAVPPSACGRSSSQLRDAGDGELSKGAVRGQGD